MTPTLRQKVYNKFNGRCAYSGTKLEDDWQVDHIIPKHLMNILGPEARKRMGFTPGVDDMDNLMPVQKIVNHYKRSLTLEQFRVWYLGGLHKRLKKLPKNPKVERSINHKRYLLEVAGLFGITPDKPFSGVFYFEQILKRTK